MSRPVGRLATLGRDDDVSSGQICRRGRGLSGGHGGLDDSYFRGSAIIDCGSHGHIVTVGDVYNHQQWLGNHSQLGERSLERRCKLQSNELVDVHDDRTFCCDIAGPEFDIDDEHRSDYELIHYIERRAGIEHVAQHSDLDAIADLYLGALLLRFVVKFIGDVSIVEPDGFPIRGGGISHHDFDIGAADHVGSLGTGVELRGHDYDHSGQSGRNNGDIG